MGRLDEFLASKVNDCIKNNVEVTESLLKTFKNEFNIIRQRGNVHRGTLTDRIIKEYRKNRINTFRNIPKKVILGYKDEAYNTESEMIIGYVTPEYKDLSKDEKEIWNELEKEKEVL